MPKFRRLTIDELEELKDEFINFLTVSGIYADDWQKILKKQPVAADNFIDNFSDLVFEKSLKKIKYLENKSDKDLKLFKCLDDKIQLIGLEVKEGSEFSFENAFQSLDDYQMDILKYKTEKAYRPERSVELYNMMQAGCTDSDGVLFESLSA
jgi:hypothetical protein